MKATIAAPTDKVFHLVEGRLSENLSQNHTTMLRTADSRQTGPA